MKRVSILIAAMSLMLSSLTFAAVEEGATKVELETSSEKLSYALGLDVGNSLKDLETELDLGFFVRGLEDSFKGSKPLLAPEEAARIQQAFFKRRQQELARKRQELGEKNRKEGEAFLAANGKKEGVRTTASGLQYMVLRDGEGPSPKRGDRVTVNYRGTLIDGTEFDSSYKRGQPATFELTRVIAGWTEALQLMKVGSRYRLFVPSGLGYGERGHGRQIPPNATLIFEVELLGIEE